MSTTLIEPATGQSFASVTRASVDDVDATIRNAQRASPAAIAWHTMQGENRPAKCRRWIRSAGVLAG